MMQDTWIIGQHFQVHRSKQSLLGRGGMGKVYRGVDTRTGEPVAIKVLKSDIIRTDAGLVARFVREGEALRQLEHPHIVRLIDVIQEPDALTDADAYYLVMEYVAGGSLNDLLEREGRLPAARALNIAIDLADALTRAHRLGIIHRDLKPANVLLDEQGTVRLTDFGVAHLPDKPRLTQTGIMLGTVDYLSPEACSGDRLDTRADIWSFGVLLWEMLTGHAPFAGGSLLATLNAILTAPLPDLEAACPDAPVALVDLVYRMLQRDRLARIPSMRLVGAELEMILAGLDADQDADQGAVPLALPAVPTSRFATPTPAIDGMTPSMAGNLPVQPTPFVGREAELVELGRLITNPEVRLVTVLGPGGMGKTRLALEAAEKALQRSEPWQGLHFADGVYWVSLAPLQSIEAIVPAVADALDFQFYEGQTPPRQQLLDYLRNKQMLLLLDNYEHLLDDADLVAAILTTAQHVKIIATSRINLNIQGEHRFHISGLQFPDWETPEDALEYSAVKLFLQGARRAKPGFKLQADDLKYVARLCRLVQGMPLGILLSASWLAMLTLQEIAAQVTQDLDFLESDLRDLPERQRSMRAVFDYSWNLLDEREQAVFAALSVFRGGFTREAAQTVTGTGLRQLMALTNKSLIHRTPEGRYEVHELLRQYAEEELARSGYEDGIRDRHCAYYASVLQNWAQALKGNQRMVAIPALEADIENARAAWEWASVHARAERINQAIDGLCMFYEWRGRYQEGETICQLAATELQADMSDIGQQVLAKVLAWQGTFERTLGHIQVADRVLTQSLSLLEQSASGRQDLASETAFASLQKGRIKFLLGKLDEARLLYGQSLAHYRELGDQWGVAQALYVLGEVANNVNDFSESVSLQKKSLSIRRELNDLKGVADSLVELGSTAIGRGQPEEAERLVQEAAVIRRELGDRSGVANSFFSLACAIMSQGRFDEAASLLTECAAIQDDLGNRIALLWVNQILGWCMTNLGQYEQAQTLSQETLAVCRSIGFRRLIGLALLGQGGIAIVREAYTEAWRKLQESLVIFCELEQQSEEGRTLVYLGQVAMELDKTVQSRHYLSAGLRIARDVGSVVSIHLLGAVAMFFRAQGQIERAVDLYALALRYPNISNSRYWYDIVGKHIAAAAASLPPDVVQAAQERGRARDLESTVRELLQEFEEPADG